MDEPVGELGQLLDRLRGVLALPGVLDLGGLGAGQAFAPVVAVRVECCGDGVQSARAAGVCGPRLAVVAVIDVVDLEQRAAAGAQTLVQQFARVVDACSSPVVQRQQEPDQDGARRHTLVRVAGPGAR